jgi:hypothetical protein
LATSDVDVIVNDINLSADIDNTFATLVLSSLDANPLACSSRMLLSPGSRVSNTGLNWNPERTRTLDQADLHRSSNDRHSR